LFTMIRFFPKKSCLWINMPTFFVFLVLLLVSCPVFGGENARIEGSISDASGRPVAGAQLFVYDSLNVRRPAEFSSKKTGDDGYYEVVVVPGTYWLVAVYRKNGGSFGPLQLEDKHSGQPVKIRIKAGISKKKNFTVLDLRDAARMHRKENKEMVKISGRVIDSKGKSVDMAYVIADTKKIMGPYPAYVSAWTDDDGVFELFVPAGHYHLAAMRTYPPAKGTQLTAEVNSPEAVRDLQLSISDN